MVIALLSVIDEIDVRGKLLADDSWESEDDIIGVFSV